MRQANIEELRASAALQETMVRDTPIIGHVSVTRLRHAQLGTSWGRAAALIVVAFLLAALVANILPRL
jgi:hypothetical protein